MGQASVPFRSRQMFLTRKGRFQCGASNTARVLMFPVLSWNASGLDNIVPGRKKCTQRCQTCLSWTYRTGWTCCCRQRPQPSVWFEIRLRMVLESGSGAEAGVGLGDVRPKKMRGRPRHGCTGWTKFRIQCRPGPMLCPASTPMTRHEKYVPEPNVCPGCITHT